MAGATESGVGGALSSSRPTALSAFRTADLGGLDYGEADDGDDGEEVFAAPAGVQEALPVGDSGVVCATDTRSTALKVLTAYLPCMAIFPCHTTIL